MSKITLEPNSSGAGTFSIVSPDSNTNRTLTLPDKAGEFMTTEGRSKADVLTNLYFTGITTSNQNIGGSDNVILWPSDYNPDLLYDSSTGEFTVDSSNEGTYLILTDITVYSLQSPSGASTLITKVRKNGNRISERLMEEETNPDETAAGNAHSVAVFLSAGDYIDVTAQLNSSSGAKNVQSGSSLTIIKLL